ncbi:hypothetical protein V2J09_016939 [Rumex salicifolius]
MGTPREHIEDIRRKKYQIGIGTISVSRDLRMAVKYLSTELYSKDVHFLMELIQNAEDNEYEDGIEPSLEFMLTSKDITGTGAPMTLLVFNNEKGFSRRNMDSVCSIGDSSKTGHRRSGYIGEKGIGFKSVFLLTSQPYIFSNGYQVRFNEEPCPYCEIAYIVPEWVAENPTVPEIQRIYGCSQLPTTTIILPLKREKVDSVKKQLSSIHPELLLFLSKIRRLSVKETVDDHHKPNSLRAISISSEKNFVSKKNIDAESFTLLLTSSEVEGEERECSYYMWRQKFTVRQENRVQRRMEVDEWSITLAFPFGQRLNRGMMEAGIYAFLPTEMVTNLPFIIQADFILQSSREKIVMDDVWNLGILSCVATAFMDAFKCLVKSNENAPVSSIATFFEFLPTKSSPFPELDAVRESIKKKVLQESIVPSESFSKQLFFHKPAEVSRISRAFWNILSKAKEQGVKFHGLSSHGKFILSSSFDRDEYNDILTFLGVVYVDNEWYSKCISGCNLVLGVDNDVYVQLLNFIAVNWSSCLENTTVKNIPLLKYVNKDGNSSLLKMEEVSGSSGHTLCRSEDSSYATWLIKWSKEFKCAPELCFMPEVIQKKCLRSDSLLIWLRDRVKVKAFTVYGYADKLCQSSLCWDRSLLLAFAHFLHHSFSAGYLSISELEKLSSKMPLINNYGQIVASRNAVLVPADGSKWVQLVNSNPWKDEGYVELHEDYLHNGYFGGKYSSEKELILFLRNYVRASDIPELTPPNVSLPCVSAPLTKENVFLLLEWIRKLRFRGIALPANFLRSITEGNWLKVSMSGCPGYRSPCQSFLHSSSWGSLLQNASVMIDIPIIDQSFYDHKLSSYADELKAIGVMSTYDEASKFIGDRLMRLAETSCLTKNHVMAMLGLIRFLRDKYLSPDEYIASIKTGSWMRTSRGVRSPVGSVLYGDSWKIVSEVSDVPFIDQNYYGSFLLDYKNEVQLLEVVTEFKDNYQIVKDYLKSTNCLHYLSSGALILMLKCIRNCTSSGQIVSVLKNAKCVNTNNGFKYPSECFLNDPTWGCILRVFDGFPYIDGNFYGTDILHYKSELREIGVVVDLEEAANAFLKVFKEKTSSSSFTKEHVFSFLACYRELRKKRELVLPTDFKKCISKQKWLRTRLAAYMSPKDCILFSKEWDSISKITTLPFIDDSDRCYGNQIHEYKEELASMGVVVDIKDGPRFVLSHIYFPGDVNQITPASVLSLLNIIRLTKRDDNGCLPDSFLKKISERAWLKTTFGYMHPADCILYSSNWTAFLKVQDAPCIDVEHYGPQISSYGKELQAIGVTVDVAAGASLLAGHITLLSDFDSIKRVYSFLEHHSWDPKGEASSMIWIPTDDGRWVSPADCVLYNKDNLFGSRLIGLETHYDPKLLSFFGRAFGVRWHPSMDDYCRLWKDWESSVDPPSVTDCCAFWSYAVKHWNLKTEKFMSEVVSRVPARCPSPSTAIQLIDKRDVYIPDDLLLKDLFMNSCQLPLFVWTPENIPHSKLLEVYRSIGVRTISSVVVKAECLPSSVSSSLSFKETSRADVFIRKGLAMLVLGFLADPKLEMDPKRRRETVQRLLDVAALETTEPITMRYELTLCRGDVLNVDASRMILWDRNENKLYAQKMERLHGYKNVVEFATNFAQVVSEGLLWEKEDHITELSDLIKFGLLLDFHEDAVVYCMKSKNLQLFAEDEDFLASAFPFERYIS